ncbi:hypothetical protein L3X38_036767 [Prunus dulcis]|uniref:Uncharacterized protein n=1 Tax=Prunus dulcis TaxID=3755 RepID=A0AAD4V220_PRUDU|nr:hypothetical protein L3X38_036767 [Prunus dulcis]
MAALFGFKPYRMSIDVLGDYELKNSFHKFWENRLFSWLLESAKLLYTTAFKDCPIDDRARRGIHAEEIEASLDAGSDRSKSPLASGGGSLEGKDRGRTSIPPPPSQLSSSNLDLRHKGKALLVEDEDVGKEEVHFQRKCRAPATPAKRVESESAPIEEPSGSDTSIPRSSRSTNFTSAKGKRILKFLKKADEALGAVVDKLKGLWTLFRSPDFDLV